MSDHVVREGECLSSIAFEHGFHWQTLLDHPDNAELKAKREEQPFVLAPGDVVRIPERVTTPAMRPTGARHTFQRKGVPERLKVQFLDATGKPRANLPYTLDIDGKVVSGTTDGRGRIDHPIPPSARRGRLVFEDGERHELLLGYLDPASTLRGVEQRLINMGLLDGPPRGRMTLELSEALQELQSRAGLPPTGEIDDETRAALKDACGG